MAGAREWDAGTYDRVSGPQHAWGAEVVADLDLEGDELVLDAGCGTGNVAAFVAIADGVAEREPYASHLASLPPTRLFAGVEETTARLEATGFTEIRYWLEPKRAYLAEPHEFMPSVCVGAHTAPLPEELREPFVRDVYEIWGRDPVLDYVRLNIDARRPAAGN